jgi:chemotaxis protein CheX
MTIASNLLQSLNTNEEKLLQQLTHDVRDIFDTMVGIDGLLHLPIYIDPVTHFKDCISSMVGFAGIYNGLVSMHMTSSLAMAVAGCMLGEDVSDINDDVNDAIGEITNMIAGSFKQHLSKSGLDIQISIPSIVNGNEYVITLGNNPDQIAVRFATDDDWFMVAVAFEKS